MLKKLIFSFLSLSMALAAPAQTADTADNASETAEKYVKIPKTYRYRVYFTFLKKHWPAVKSMA